jgi:hypothetical protein
MANFKPPVVGAPSTVEGEAAQNAVIHSTFYTASSSIATPTISVAADRRKLVIPTDGGIKIGTGFYPWSGIPNLDIEVAANWDTVAVDYTVALTRRGMNLYLYECQHSGQTAPDFIFSANSTIPTGYDANNSRKVATFHTLPVSLGTIASHDLSGYLVGDIVPCSIADLLHRPSSAPEGMVVGQRLNGQGIADVWVDAYLASGTGVNTASAWNATISDTRTWYDFVDDFDAVGKFLPSDHHFQRLAAGSPEQVALYGLKDPVATGQIGTSLITGATLTGTTFSRAAFSHASFNQEYEVEIDGNGAPDTFKWKQKTFGGAFGASTATVPIQAGANTLADGITITFPATTGLTIGHKINVYVMDAPFSTAGVPIISHVGAWGMTGNLWQWLADQSYRFDGAAAHTHQVVASGDPETITSGNASGDLTPVASYKTIGGSKGLVSTQGTYGLTKLMAGGPYNGTGSNSGSRCRSITSWPWDTGVNISARGCSRSKRS